MTRTVGAMRRAAWALAAVLALHTMACRAPEGRDETDTTPAQRELLSELAAGGADPAARRAAIQRRPRARAGPYPTHLRHAAVAETLRRCQSMLMDGRPVAVDLPLTPELTDAVREAGVSAEVLNGRAPEPSPQREAVKVRVVAEDYLADGRCAVVRVTVSRGPDWAYSQMTLFTLRGDRWALVQVIEP